MRVLLVLLTLCNLLMLAFLPAFALPQAGDGLRVGRIDQQLKSPQALQGENLPLQEHLHRRIQSRWACRQFAPFGIGAAMWYTVGHSGLSVLINLGKLVLTLYGALAVFILLVFLPVILVARIPVKQFLNAIKEPALIAFTTTSSDAALPDACKKMIAFGVPKRIVAFVMPTGYSFNLDGSTLYLSIASVFVAQAAGVHMPLSQQLLMMLTLMITSKGVAAVPRASLVILSGTLVSFGLPLEGIAVILGVDEVMDMARTTVNLIGNCLASAVMARWEGELNTDLKGEVEILTP